jgi:uncharacterized protein YyaL (SSP411 family)
VPNRLASEQSPYLLQHKDNPVEWYPWGPEAFDRARRENKPIFLSVGYSTCHWCHVMEHESFENQAIAEVLSRDFISIKVDREERPDVDRVYMTFVQATTGSGGWPMSVWLTPRLEPFYGGTYFPPESRWGRPGFIEVLQEIARVWREEQAKVEQSATTILGRLQSMRATGQAGVAVPDTTVLDRTVAEFASSFDARRGGFGGAPKFPRPSELLFLLREHARTGSAIARDMVLVTLRAMALGGMRDHLGGGFHRYSVDAEWRVPHFEKMLYDQAQLVLAYSEAAQLTGDRFYAEVAIDTLDYVRRDLTSPDGGFYSAEDADSIPPEHAHEARPHKMEGAFYIWRDDEIQEVLGADAGVFRARYGVLPDGNAPADPQGEFTEKNLLYTARSLEDVASIAGRTVEETVTALNKARSLLMSRRAARPRPHLDDKVLTAWNGLMIAAFSRAARTLEGAEACVQDAQKAARFIEERMWQPETRMLLRRYREGSAGVEAYAEDYAYLVWGLLELFQTDGDARWLEWAIALQTRQDELFWDPVDGGWFSTTGNDPSVLLRLKEDYDGAEPAASSVSVMNLLTLSHLIEGFSARIEPTLGTFTLRLTQSGRAAPMMMAALSMFHSGMPQLVMVGDPASDATRAMFDVIRHRYLPTTVVVPLIPANRSRLSEKLPWTAAMREMDGEASAYLCRNFACESPTNDPAQLERLLDRR